VTGKGFVPTGVSLYPELELGSPERLSDSPPGCSYEPAVGPSSPIGLREWCVLYVFLCVLLCFVSFCVSYVFLGVFMCSCVCHRILIVGFGVRIMRGEKDSLDCDNVVHRPKSNS